MPKYDMLLPKIEFLKEDFITLSEKLTDQYNPSNLTALANIGTILMTMSMLELEQGFHTAYKAVKDNTAKEVPTNNLMKSDISPTMKSSIGAATVMSSNNQTNDSVYDNIEDELAGAQKYYDKWIESKDFSYKQMAKDELRHADFFIKRARMSSVDKDKLQECVDKYNNLLELVK